MSKKSCLAIITARAGSKGVPGKNLREIKGKPLLEYPIDLAKSASFIDRIIVTTDSPEMQKVAINAGAEAPFLRPAELASDTARTSDALLHTMKWYEDNGGAFDYLCLLTPTTPLGQISTLTESFNKLETHPSAEAIFSVCKCSFLPQRCNVLREDGFLKDWADPKIKWKNRQELPTFHRLSGLITISKWEAFKREESFLHDKTLWTEVDSVEAVDINEPSDFFLAESLIEKGIYHSSQLAVRLQATA